MLSKEKIKESFSKHANTYDIASDFQQEAGRNLINMISPLGIGKNMILDVGIGSGKVTQRLAEVLRRKVYGCDIAWGMVSFAKQHTNQIVVNQADAEGLPFKDDIFNIAFSNITYQWVSDLNKAFLEVKRVLKKGGRFYFSILVKGSLKELYETLGEFFSAGIFMDFLPPAGSIRKTVKETDFAIIWLKDMTIRRNYKSCFDLLKSIKMVGGGRISETNLFGMGKRKLFFNMIESYDMKFNEGDEVFATYKIILGCVEKE